MICIVSWRTESDSFDSFVTTRPVLRIVPYKVKKFFCSLHSIMLEYVLYDLYCFIIMLFVVIIFFALPSYAWVCAFFFASFRHHAMLFYALPKSCLSMWFQICIVSSPWCAFICLVSCLSMCFLLCIVSSSCYACAMPCHVSCLIISFLLCIV